MHLRHKRILKPYYLSFRSFLFDPVAVARRMRAFPFFVRNAVQYRRRAARTSFAINWRELLFTSADRFAPAGASVGDYFHQDLWAARQLFERRVKEHVDVGSRLDGFVAHILPFSRVRYVDLRPLSQDIPGLAFEQGSILSLPFGTDSVATLSCLHVIEHIGLGRYGDEIDPAGHVKAAKELSRVLMVGGTLLVGTPVGRERVCFDAHRVLDPDTVVNLFPGLRLAEFSLVDDLANQVHRNATFEQARACDYGCGLFVFEKVAAGSHAAI